MKKFIIFFVVLIASTAVFAQTKAGKIDNTKHPTFYSCPVKSTVITNELDKCPFCGMDLNLSPKEQIKAQVVKSYSCPSHVDIVGGNLNISPKEEMKMQLIKFKGNPAPSGKKDLVSKQ